MGKTFQEYFAYMANATHFHAKALHFDVCYYVYKYLHVKLRNKLFYTIVAQDKILLIQTHTRLLISHTQLYTFKSSSFLKVYVASILIFTKV